MCYAGDVDGIVPHRTRLTEVSPRITTGKFPESRE